LKNTTAEKFLFVINPKSGKEQKQDPKGEIERLAAEYSILHEAFMISGEDDKLKLVRQIKAFRPDTVVAVGGDGTVNFVVSIIAGSRINMGIIPTGTANGLAYNLRIPEDFEQAFRKMTENSPMTIDVLRINRKFCVHLSDVGINARIVKRFEEAGSRGRAGYARHFLAEFFARKKIFSYTLVTPERSIVSRAEMIVIANAKSFGTGAVINPSGEIDDGIFEIIIIKPYPWWMFFYFLKVLFTGHINHRKYVRLFLGNKAEIHFKRPHDIQIDGEIVPEVVSLNILCLPKALRVHYSKE